MADAHAASTEQPPSSARSSADRTDLGGFLAPFGISVETDLVQLALTHRSWAYEHGGAPHNERLEFLGDAILGQAVTVKLFVDFPDLSEGDLSRRRAALVSSVALAEVARSVGIGEHLRLGVGEERSGGRQKESLLADAVEALIGAVYLLSDSDTATRFVLSLVEPLLADPERFTISLDPKTTVQEEADARGLARPSYEIVGSGPDHDRRFHATVTLAGVSGEGNGISKKAAEIAAARELIAKLRSSKGGLRHSKGK